MPKKNVRDFEVAVYLSDSISGMNVRVKEPERGHFPYFSGPNMAQSMGSILRYILFNIERPEPIQKFLPIPICPSIGIPVIIYVLMAISIVAFWYC